MPSPVEWIGETVASGALIGWSLREVRAFMILKDAEHGGLGTLTIVFDVPERGLWGAVVSAVYCSPEGRSRILIEKGQDELGSDIRSGGDWRSINVGTFTGTQGKRYQVICDNVPAAAWEKFRPRVWVYLEPLAAKDIQGRLDDVKVGAWLLLVGGCVFLGAALKRQSGRTAETHKLLGV